MRTDYYEQAFLSAVRTADPSLLLAALNFAALASSIRKLAHAFPSHPFVVKDSFQAYQTGGSSAMSHRALGLKARGSV